MLSFLTSAGFIPDFPIVGSPQWVHAKQKHLEATLFLGRSSRTPASLARVRPLRLKPSGEFLKTAHWAVFLTEFHLIGSSPFRLEAAIGRNPPGSHALPW